MAGATRLVQRRRAFGFDRDDLRGLADRGRAARYKAAAAYREGSKEYTPARAA